MFKSEKTKNKFSNIILCEYNIKRTNLTFKC